MGCRLATARGLRNHCCHDIGLVKKLLIFLITDLLGFVLVLGTWDFLTLHRPFSAQYLFVIYFIYFRGFHTDLRVA
jgi:hypothetical protein